MREIFYRFKDELPAKISCKLWDIVQGDKLVFAFLSSSSPPQTRMRKALDRVGAGEGLGVRRREEKVEKNWWVNGVGRFRLLFTSPLRSKKTRIAESM